MSLKNEKVLLDANFIIDFFKTNNDDIITIICDFVEEAYVPSVIVQEVYKTTTPIKLMSTGVKLTAPPLHILIKAQQSKGSLSFQDWICLYLCKENSWICITSDNYLVKKCRDENVRNKRGFRILLDLVLEKAINKSKAKSIFYDIKKITLGFQKMSSKIS
ncbi:MAG: hypothetical protein H7A23_23335 [Leptospiraceae bacterium]|nr:hypothetical protein [Leptospiraceae bacterium]MCP5497501.1 hypothetical protein [Leptospiraceae bacterium]